MQRSDLNDLADPAARRDLSHLSDGRIETARVRDHELDLLFFRRRDHPVAVLQGDGHRLFNHDVLAVFNGGE